MIDFSKHDSRLSKITIAESQRAKVTYEDIYPHMKQKRDCPVEQKLPGFAYKTLNRIKLHYLLSLGQINSDKFDELDKMLRMPGGDHSDKLKAADNKKLAALSVCEIGISYDDEDKVTPNCITLKCRQRALKRTTGARPAPPIYAKDKEYSRASELFGLLDLVEKDMHRYVVEGATLQEAPPMVAVADAEDAEEGKKVETAAKAAATDKPAKRRGRPPKKKAEQATAQA